MLPNQFCRYSDLVDRYLGLRRSSSIGGMKFISSVRETLNQQEQSCELRDEEIKQRVEANVQLLLLLINQAPSYLVKDVLQK